MRWPMMFFERMKQGHNSAESGLITTEPAENHVVAVFGAGASMAAGGIGVAGIFERGFRQSFVRRFRWSRSVKAFLRDVFCVGESDFGSRTHLPDIIMVLSLVDLAIDRGDTLVAQNPVARKKAWSHAELVEIREKLEGLILQAVLEPYLEQFKMQKRTLDPGEAATSFVHEIFLDHLHRIDPAFSLLSMNYDMFVDRAVVQHLDWLRSSDHDEAVTCPHYDVAFEGMAHHVCGARTLHKLHGSCDWANCSGCGRITLLYTEQYLRERGIADDSRTLERFDKELLGPRTARCDRCGSMLRPVIVPPTLMKNYCNSHIRHVWSHAERVLRKATEIWFVGYGLPTDDLEFISMLKRHTQDIERHRIHVIVKDPDAIWRYHSVFGHAIDVHVGPFEDWVQQNLPDIVTDYCDYSRCRAEALDRPRPDPGHHVGESRDSVGFGAAQEEFEKA